MGSANEELDGKHGVQSLEVGMSILRAMATGRRSMMLKEIAEAAGMPPSKAHRYLVSLIRSGLVEQDRLTSRYDLGPFALNLGLAHKSAHPVDLAQSRPFWLGHQHKIGW